MMDSPVSPAQPQPNNRQRNLIIFAVVGGLFLCCCCALVAGYLGWACGDMVTLGASSCQWWPLVP
jgi:type VI protein secretion system component VasF